MPTKPTFKKDKKRKIASTEATTFVSDKELNIAFDKAVTEMNENREKRGYPARSKSEVFRHLQFVFCNVGDDIFKVHKFKDYGKTTTNSRGVEGSEES